MALFKVDNGWMPLFYLATARVSITYQLQLVASTSPLLMDRFQLSLGDIGLLIGLYLFPGTFISLPIGHLGVKVSERRLAIIAFGLMAFGGILFAIASTTLILFVSRLLAGFGAIILNLTLSSALSERYVGRSAPFAMALFANSWPIGLGFGALTLGPISSYWGWRWAALATVLLVGISALLCQFVLQNKSLKSTRNIYPSLQKVLGILGCGSIWALTNASFILLVSFIPLVLISRGISEGVASLCAAIIVIVSCVFVPLGGYLALIGVSRIILVILPLSIWSVASIVMPFTGGTLLFSLAILCGLVSALPGGILFSLASRTESGAPGSVIMGIFYTAFYIQITAFVWVAGEAGGLWGAKVIFALCGGFVLAAALLFLIIETLIARRPDS